MATPTYTLEYAATASPLDATPTWTTISSDDILSVDIVMGRQSETDRSTQPSSMTVRLDNRARTYDPLTNSNLTPSRQVRLTATHNTVDYVLFRGVVNLDGWQQVEYQHPDTSSCVIVCLDLLGHIAQRAARYPLFEQRIYQIAYDAGLLDPDLRPSNYVRHHPLGDNVTDSPYGRNTFQTGRMWDGQSLQPSYTSDGGVTVEVPPADVYSETSVRDTHEGSLDGWLGCAVIRVARGWPNRSDGNYANWSLGFSFKLRSLPAEDDAALGATIGGGTGFFVDRDGTLTASIGDGLTSTSSTNTFEPGRTYQLTATWDGTAGGSLGELTVYINGVKWIEVTNHATVTTGLAGLGYYLGTQGNNGTQRMDVLYSDVWSISQHTITATDAAGLFDLWVIKGVKTGRAAGLLCDAIGLPHNITTSGRIGVREIVDSQPNIVNLLQDIERAERGRIYYDHANEEVAMVTWSDLVTATRHTVVQLKLSDDPAEAGTFLRYSNPEIVNLQPITTATITAGDVTYTWFDLDDVDLYGEQSISYSTLSGVEFDAVSLASTEVWRNSTPATAVRSLTVEPTTTAEFTSALALDLFDLIELTRKPHDTGAQSTANYLVGGITYSIGGGDADWRMTLFLTPQDDVDDVGVWGTVKFSDHTAGVVEA